MILYVIEPEVAGGIGENSVFENLEASQNEKEIPIISHLHYEFSGWLGDDILESTPCFIVTERLAKNIINNDLKGFKLTNVEISTNEEYNDINSNKILPSFRRLIPLGKIKIEDGKFNDWTGDDFNLSEKNYLVVTKKALLVIEDFNFNHCDITTLTEF